MKHSEPSKLMSARNPSMTSPTRAQTGSAAKPGSPPMSERMDRNTKDCRAPNAGKSGTNSTEAMSPTAQPRPLMSNRSAAKPLRGEIKGR